MSWGRAGAQTKWPTACSEALFEKFWTFCQRAAPADLDLGLVVSKTVRKEIYAI